MSAEERWLVIDEIPKHHGVSKDTVYGRLTRKSMSAQRVGRFSKLKKDEFKKDGPKKEKIDEWVRARGAAAAAADGRDVAGERDEGEEP